MAPLRLLRFRSLGRACGRLPSPHSRYSPSPLSPSIPDLTVKAALLTPTRVAPRQCLVPTLHHDLPSSLWAAALKFNLRSYAKAKKSKGDEESSAVFEDVYPRLKESSVKLMESALEALSRELSKLRTGRASAGMLDHVTVVDNNGIRSPLTHLAAVTVKDNEKLRVTAFDSSIVKCVERGIRSSPLQLNPVCEGDIIIVPIPKPTKEHIESMAKLVGKAGEAAKLSIRRARQTAMDGIKKSSDSVSKDDIKRREKEIEELTKKFVKTMEDTCKAKEQEMISP